MAGRLTALRQRIWLLPLACLAIAPVFSGRFARKDRALIILLAGGVLNWLLQPMFNNWYSAPLTAALCVAAAVGAAGLFDSLPQRLVLVSTLGLYAALVPSTGWRWTKLLYDPRYRLVDHYSRETVSLCKDNTTAAEQEWIRSEVRKHIDENGRTGVLFSDPTVLHAAGTRNGFWAIFWTSQHAERLLWEVRDATPDVIVAVDPGRPLPPTPYQERLSEIGWDVPQDIRSAIAERYAVSARKYGFVIYVRNELLATGARTLAAVPVNSSEDSTE